MSKGQRAIQELQRRFGGSVDPGQAFQMMDQAMSNIVGENEVLKNLLMALAFDDGRVRHACKTLEHGTQCIGIPCSCGLTVLEGLLDLERVEIVEKPVPRLTQASPRVLL